MGAARVGAAAVWLPAGWNVGAEAVSFAPEGPVRPAPPGEFALLPAGLPAVGFGEEFDWGAVKSPVPVA